jgi:SAM-dependent methyltransferase
LRICSLCGGTSFIDMPVVWDELAAQWELSPDERAYVNRQQGTICKSCGANLRSIALCDAMRNALGTTVTLRQFASSSRAKTLSVLEINEAGMLSPVLSTLPGHVLAEYPRVDIHQMPYSDGQFDFVLHSDTLEHVSDPVRALAECRRVLRPDGWLCYTVPTIVGRMSRGRAGLERSFHGDPRFPTDDYLVHTEFGADMWTVVLRAGFKAVTITSLEFPTALALSAQKGLR